MQCPNCKKEVPDSAKVCGYCGTRLIDSVAKSCPSCGTPVRAGDQFCQHCGAKLDQPAAKADDQISVQEAPAVKKVGKGKGPTKGTGPVSEDHPHASGAGINAKAKLPGWVLPVIGLAVVLGIAAIFLVFSSGGSKERVLIKWQCDQETVQGGQEIAIYYKWTTLEADQIDPFFDVADHQVSVNYTPFAIRSDGLEAMEQDQDGNYYRTYWMSLGKLKPGSYFVETHVDITERVFDGWDWFGPDTEFPSFYRSCTIIVE